MLTILNNYQHGFVAIPVVLACKRHGLFELCQQLSPLPFDVLVKELRANSGHLRVALHMLVSMQWLSHDDDDRYALTPISELHRRIPEDITSLLSFPVHAYVSKRSNRLSLKTWVELSGQRWNIQDPTMALFLDGLLMIPLLLALRERSLSHDSDQRGGSLFTALPSGARAEIVALLAGKGWLDHADRPLSEGGPALNEAGRFMVGRSLITATVASYRPMLTNIAGVIFGNCAAMFRRDEAGHETHVDRTLNVVGSGFQHKRYFDQMEEAILAVFNREPYEDQPRYVADMGCGDGTLLRKIYDLIKAKSLRGKVLDRHPIKLIGVDYNAQALEATGRTLAGSEYLVLQGDIGDPARLIEDLRDQGIQDPEHILHVRSFLDHDRTYKPPQDHAAMQARAHLAYHGVYVDREGNGLPPAAVVQSLVEHLQGWSSIIGHHGLMMLEVHCLEPRTIARFIPQCESLHMDAYHRFSQQLLVEADHFIMAAAEVGLCPDWEFFKKYPNRQPYTRITLSYLQKRDYTMRHPNETDVHALVAFERRCLPESQAASVEEIRQRIVRYPDGQCLLEVDGQLAAVAYSQRVSRATGPDEPGETVQPAWAHADDGAVAELLYVLCPSVGQKTHGHDLVRFMTHWLELKDGIETVTGAMRCERYLERSAHGVEGVMAIVRDYMQRYAIGPEADTHAPETELSTFGTRWLLRIFQDLGVMTMPNQVYDLQDLIQRLGILPKYERLCAALVRLLAREEVLRVAGNRVEVMPLATTFALQDVEAECAQFLADFSRKYEDFQLFLELIYRCLKQFAAVLTGTVSANDVVFPNGSMHVFVGLFRGNAVADYFNALVAEIVLANITLARQHAPETRLSILEIGAGTGSTTRVVLEKIQHLASVLSFHYTDISSAFTRHGERTFSEQFPWVKFHRLDIEEDPIAQGFQPECFDLIYAANTLHDTRNIPQTLAQVQTLLKPGGLLVVNEFTAMKDVLLFTGGLLHGYWLFEDADFRLQDSCLLSVDRWQEAMTTSGFQLVKALGLPFEETPSGQSVIICAKSGNSDAAGEHAQGVPALRGRASAAVIEAVVREIIGPKRMESLAPDTPLMESGLDSMELLDLRMLLSKTFGVDLDATFLFQRNTLRKVSAFFQQDLPPVQHESHLGFHQNASPAESMAFQVPFSPDKSSRQSDVAIIGMALRLPGQVQTPEDFWRLLQNGASAIGTMPEERWHRPSNLALAADKPYLRKGGFLSRIDEFDAAFFRISPREAELLDPQQRVLLELGWEVMEDAGYKPSLLSGSDTGVFIGACHFDYHRLLEECGLGAEALAATGTGGSILANRLSYFYNFQGPSMVIDAACSSSLLAVHAAVRALRDGSCDQALVGGVNLICHSTNTLSYDKAGMLSKDGTCYTFDARANGYVRGEGAALVFLKRLDRAIRDNDPIYAVIRGSAVNHGGQASSLTAPNPEAQARLIIKAWQDAEVAADSVTYIEAHGTGTPLGDPIEVEGIRQARARSRANGLQGHSCGLGSLKSNIGHLEGAAGIAGLIKVVLCLQHQMLPKSINFQTLNPEIKLTAPLYIVDQTQPWQPPRDQAGVALPRRAGVSSFGFGGANAHVVLEEFPQDAGDHRVAGPYLFVLSARDQSRLLAYAERFLVFLERRQAAALSLAGMTYALQNGREEMDERLAILFTDLAQLRERLQRFCAGQQAISDLYHGNAQQSAAEYDLLTAGPAGCTFMQNLIAERDYGRLALLWVRGARIKWSALFGHQPPAKVRLPTYPFARERFWVPHTRAEEATAASASDDRMHAVAKSTSGLGAADEAAVDHGSDDHHTLILTPAWASVSHATSPVSQAFPATVDRVIIVDGYGEIAGEGSAAYRHALQQRYPGAHLLLIRPEDTVDTMRRTLDELSGRLAGAVNHIFWIAPGPHADPVSIVRRDLVKGQRRGVLPLFRLIKALLRIGYGTRALGWTVITTRAQPIHQQDSIDPAHAGMHGLIGSLAKEFPHWKVRLIDLDAPCDPDGRAADLPLDDLLALPPDPEGNAWACRGSTDGVPRWFRQQLVPAALPMVSRSLYRAGGVYVVIGGAGGVGEVWSEYMLRTYGARLVWINRRPLDQAVQGKLDRLARLGPMPDYISADATDAVALRRAYEDIKARHGQINGVVHAAVVLLDQSLANMDEARFLAGLAAKVDTSVQMARVFRREPLDFVLFFSSIMTFLKPPGQANYTAGCTFQDAFAHRLGTEWFHSQGGPVVKVMHWGYWGSVGVAASEAYRERMAKAGLSSIRPSEAMAALEALLAGPLDRLVLVRTVEPTIFPLPSGEGQAEGSRTVATSFPPSPQPSPGRRGGQREPYPYPDNDLEERILVDVLRAASQALEVVPADLDVDVDLHEYGFDTVSLADMTREINRTYGVDERGCNLGTRPLTASDVLETQGGQAPTLRGVARFLIEEYGEVLRQAVPSASHSSTVVPAMHPQQPTVTNAAPKFTGPWVGLVAYVKAMIRDCLARSLKTSKTDIDDDVAFSEYGLESILTAAFIVDVNSRLGIAMNEAIVFDHTTVTRLADHVVHTYRADIENARGIAAESPPNTEPPKTVSHQHAPARPAVRTPTHESDELCTPVETPRTPWKQLALRATDIAVIGMSGQFPDAGDIHSFWENLMAGRDCVHELPPHYLDQAKYFSAEKQPGKTYSRWGGILQDRDCFDPLFFNISPREARSMTPHQRLILQESWKSLEDAGYNPKDLGEAPVAVFIGAEPADYFHETFTGASDAIIASRLSYYLNLRGPAMVVNTACSSSGVAIHLACESLRHGESSMALAGGVFVLTDESLLVRLSAMDMLSPTGRCQTFDRRGDGMVVSEGVGVVVLKRLDDAIADGDPILGVIQASGVNQDGASNGITAPSGAAQEELIASVYQRFGINPAEISYVEAHGTGTRLGDPVEANALVRAFRRFTDKRHFCAVGSAKAAIGHTAASAAVVSLIKVLLSLKYRTIPGLVGLEQLNPLIEHDDTPFYVNTRPQPWHAIDGKPLMAALNSFGHSGTNVHLVIREHPADPPPMASPVPEMVPMFIPLSAKTSERLTIYAEHLSHFLSSPAGRDIHLGDVAHTLQVGREAMKERVLFLVRDIPELAAMLQDFAAGSRSIDGCWVGRVDRNGEALHVLTSQEDSREMLTRWIATGEYEKIGEWWTRGVTLDWRMLDGERHAETRRPRRISLPAYPFAKERYWTAPSHADSEGIPSVMHAISVPLPVEDARIAHILANGELLNRDLDDLLCKLFWGTLQSLGLCREEHLRLSHFETIAGIDKKYERWLEESLSMLVVMGYLEQGGGGYRVLCPSPLDLDMLWREWDRQKAIWSWDPHKKTQVALVDATLRFLPLILTGKRKVTDFLFPDSSMALVEGIYTHNLVADFFNEASADVLVTYIDQRLAQRSSDAKLGLRILEIGAGTGGTTGVVLSRLQPYCEHIQEYCYTDLSNAFLIHAQKHYAPGRPFLKTRIFNMEAPAAELDIDRNAYDVVIATNALHATRRVRQPLCLIKAILKKHGLLLLNELSSKPRPFFIHLSLALLDGWWLYEDPELRIPGCPGLLPHTWEQMLREEGFRSVFFPVEKAHMLGQQIVMAESDGICVPVDAPAAAPVHQAAEATAQRATAYLPAVPVKDGATGTRLDEHVKATIIESLSASLELAMGRIDMDEPFVDYGLDSIMAVNLVQVLNRAFRLDPAAHPLVTTALFDYGSVNQLAAHLLSQYGSVIVATLNGAPMPTLEATPTLPAALSPEVARPSVRTAGMHDHADAIAVVGMSGRFPGSETLEAFWQHLITGTDLVQEVSRWDLAAYFPDASPEHRTYCAHGSFLDHIDQFDPLFFKISALEAKYMDPQQRLFLEASWKALEEAGYAGDAVRGRRCGVYVGCVSGDYAKLFRDEPPEQAFWGNAGSIIPARIAYYLDLQGPAIAVDTACSSSAVAIHLACQALRTGEIDMALAGGVYIQSTPELYISGSRAGMLSLTGRCFTFDQRADGFVPGEGVGVLVLKCLHDAIADGDYIHGVIRGSGINQDGTTNGITAPSARSQERLLREVYDRFNIDPEQIQMVEAHGTGTILGDPIEVAALTRAFRHYTDQEAYCALGTVKTNIGHTSMTAGVAGVLKILLAMKHQQIPPTLNCESPNERIAFEHSPFFVNTQPRQWTVNERGTRCAVTSAFGFSGTNAHLVIEEAPRVERDHAPMPGYLCVLSARTFEQLRRRAEDLLACCERQEGMDLGNMCYTLLLGRSHFNHRLACVVCTLAELIRYLRTWLERGSSLQVYVAELEEGQQRQRASLTRHGNQCIEACRQADDPAEYLEHLATIADLYIQGYRLEFSQLFSDGYTKVPLPTYPFARESYWAPAAALPAPIRAASSVGHAAPPPPASIHSLLHRNTSNFTAQRFTSHFSGYEFFLADHWIAGRQLLPGVVQLEMARAAVAAAADLRVEAGLRLYDVVWAQPLVVDESTGDIHISLVPQAHANDRAARAGLVLFEVYAESGAGERLVHSQGTVSMSAPTGASTLDLIGLRAQINRDRLSAEQCYEAFRALGIRHGPSLQGLDVVFRGDDQVLARLRPPAAAGDLVMHPTILDAALQACFFLLTEEGDTEIRLPFSLAELELFRPSTTPAWAWLRRAEKAGQVDIDLCDEQGHVCLRFKGLSFRARAETPTTAQALLLEPAWEERAAGQGAHRFDHHLVVLAGMDALAQKDIESGITGCRCLMLPVTHQPIEERFQHHAVQVFEAVREMLRQHNGANTLLQVVCPVGGQERLFAALAGLLYIATQEGLSTVGQLIELNPGKDLVARLKENNGSPEARHVCYLRGKRYVSSWRALDAAGQQASSPWKDGGTYLITGGLGGLGLIVAREIAARTQNVTLILAGRSPLASDRHAIEELQALGAVVEYHQVDVAAAGQVNQLIQYIRERTRSRVVGPGINGPLQGIIHAAGVHHDNRIINKTADEFARVLAPKVAGAANLDRATHDLDLDVFVLFSSIAVAVGNPGQADYATANAFMDAYAAWRNSLVATGQRRGQTLSINWPLWQEGRMRADREIERMVAQRTGLVAMESPVGIRALVQALALGKNQVMVLNGDPRKLSAALSTARSGPGTTSADTHASLRQEQLPDVATSDLRQKTHDYFKQQIAAVVQLPPYRIDADAALEQYGFDSILLMKMTNMLQETFGPLSKTLLFEYPNIRELTTYFLETFPDKLYALLGSGAPEVRSSVPKPPDNRASAFDLGDGVTGNTTNLNGARHPARRPFMSASMHASVRERQPVTTDIAVIGLTGRYAQASNLAEFWENLKAGKDCITEIPKERLDLERFFDWDKDKPGKVYCRWGGFIDGVDQFDPLFFNISPRVATLMDPAERLFLETVWNLFEETGHTRKRLQQRYEGKVGVFVGAMHQQYLLFDADLDSAATVSLSTHSHLANRVSYFFNLRGPSIAVDTMCSSSLMAVHMACQSLLREECALAVAGGANFSLHPKKFIGLSRTRSIASQPDRRSFGDGDGLLPADGVGAVLLKPLSRALVDGDEILAVIRSTATNHGGYANGFYVPNPQAQAQLLIDNFEKSGIDPRTISYVEAAANGSALADPIEMIALNKAFIRFTDDRGFCAIGSVKSNIGHSEAASGMAQLAKVILQLRHGRLVPSIKARPLNPNISFADTPFYLQETLSEWQRPRLEVTGPDGHRLEQEIPRRATISSFGAGGSNAHLIIEEYIQEACIETVRPFREATPYIVVFSAKSPERLRVVVRRMLDFLVAAEPEPALADLAYTLQVRREAMTSRLAMVVRHWEELLRGMAAFLEVPGGPEIASIPMFMGDTEEDQGLDDLLASEAVRQVLLHERDLKQLARYWTRGGDIPWDVLHEGEQPRLIRLPTYPFAWERYWLAVSPEEPHSELAVEPTPEPAAPSGIDCDRVQAFLLHFLSRELRLTLDQVRPHRDLRDYGADSITAMRLIRAVEQELHVKMTGRDLLEHRTLHALCTYLAAKIDEPQAAFHPLPPGEGRGEGDCAMLPSSPHSNPLPEREGMNNLPQTAFPESEGGLEPVQPAALDALDQFQQGILTLEEMEALLGQGEML